MKAKGFVRRIDHNVDRYTWTLTITNACEINPYNEKSYKTWKKAEKAMLEMSLALGVTMDCWDSEKERRVYDGVNVWDD